METNHEKLTYWTDLIEKWKASGLSLKAYCEKEHLTYPTFCYWRRKLQEEQGAGNPGGIQVACFKLDETAGRHHAVSETIPFLARAITVGIAGTDATVSISGKLTAAQLSRILTACAADDREPIESGARYARP